MLKLGIIGLGNIGTMHVENIYKGLVKGVEITALCDIDSKKVEKIEGIIPQGVVIFSDEVEFLGCGLFDALLIATPHYSHPRLSIDGLNRGFHVMCEKPIGVYTKEIEDVIEIANKSEKIFGIMYNQRSNPIYIKVKELVDSGEIGSIKRSNWIITDWYRSQMYYDSSDWRATWGGEGGGVLLNQAPHQLDLWQWICGMPNKIRGFCYFGKSRDIEVEDDVTIYAEYPNGATGVFVSTTTDCPGTNRFEVTGSRGKIVVEDNKIRLWKLLEDEVEFNKNLSQNMDINSILAHPRYEEIEVRVEEGPESGHSYILNNWIGSIDGNNEMLARGVEGINGLTISNAAYLSTFKDGWVELPFNNDEFRDELAVRARISKYKRII